MASILPDYVASATPVPKGGPGTVVQEYGADICRALCSGSFSGKAFRKAVPAWAALCRRV